MMKKRKLISLSLLLVVITIITLGCGNDKSTPAATEENNQETVEPVEVITVNRGDITNYTTVVGTAQPSKSVQITPELQAKAKQVKVELGDQVNKGDKLLELNQSDIQAQVAQAEAGLEVAKANLKKVLTGTREEQLEQLKAQLNQAEANYEQMEKNYERQKNLYQSNVISEQQFEASKSQYIAAKSGYQAAKENLKMAQNGATAEEVATIKAQVAQAKAGLEAAKLQLAKTEIYAPLSGVVSMVKIEEGEMAAPQPLITIDKLNPIKLKAYINEMNINNLAVGEKVGVDFSSLNKSYTGKVTNISPRVDQKRGNYPVEIKVFNNDKLIKGGMHAEIQFAVSEVKNKVIIPKSAVLKSENERYVYLLEDGKAKQQTVKLGLENKDRVVITSGINPGDKVILAGNEQISTGDKVRVVNRGDK